jgi:hypothetical protein
MMQVSANEVYQTARKACLAAGYLQDRAEDVAHASCWLHYAGLNGCGELDRMLVAEIKENLTTRAQLHLHVDTSCLHITRLRPAYEGIAAIDWVLASGNGAQIQIDKISHPLMLAGLLWRAGIIYQKQFVIEADELASAVLIPDTVSGRLTEIAALSGRAVIQHSADISMDVTAPAGPCKIDKQIWERLNRLAAQTYVPETESSRLSGAGAGLVDND